MGSKKKRKLNQLAPAQGQAADPKKPKTSHNQTTADTSVQAPSFDAKPFVENLTPEDRKREAQLYEYLGDGDESTRIKAATCIISSLIGGADVPPAVLQRHLERRLFRGLASGRNTSRLGFSLVITEILGRLYGKTNLAEEKYPDLTFDKVLGFLVESTEVKGSLSGQEERDHYFGRLFGLECFVKAKIVTKDKTRWFAVLDLILGVAAAKVWMRSQCGWVIVQAIGSLKEKTVKRTLEKLAETELASSPEGLATWIAATDRLPGVKVQPWRHPLAVKNFERIAGILKEQPLDNSKDSSSIHSHAKHPNWTAQLHFVWNFIVAHFLALPEGDAGVFKAFWNIVVDNNFFSAKATESQKYSGLMVFQLMLDSLASQKAPSSIPFSKRLMSCLMNQAAKEERLVHRAAQKTLKTITAAAIEHPENLAVVLDQLLGDNGAYNFDQRTHSKTVDAILSHVVAKDEDLIVTTVQRNVIRPARDEPGTWTARLLAYSDYLARIATTCGKQRGGSGKALQEMCQISFTSTADIPQHVLTDQMRAQIQTKLEATLGRLLQNSPDMNAFCRIAASVDASQLQMPEEMRSAAESAVLRMETLVRPSANDTVDPLLALALLHAVAILQLYRQEADAVEVLNDLSDYYEKLESEDEESIGTSEFLAEILLSLIARPSSWTREVSQKVFESFTSLMTPEGMDLLLEPLAGEESVKGQRQLFNTDGDEMDVDQDASDVDRSNGTEDDEDGDSNAGSDVESNISFDELTNDEDMDHDEEDEGQHDDNSKAIGDLENALEGILKSHRLDKDADADSSDGESDADMSDSEMFDLDEKLTRIFKQSATSRGRGAKKEKKEAKDTVLNFKRRILDLVSIYIKREPLNALGLSCLLPLLRLIRSTKAKDLSQKAYGIIQDYVQAQRKARQAGGKVEGLDRREQLQALIEIHHEAQLDETNMFAAAASAASQIVASTLVAADSENIREVSAVYARTQSDWVLGKAKLKASFFTNWVNWCQAAAAKARG